MSVFSEIIIKALNDYKRILKRNLSPAEKMAKLKVLGLKRGQFTQAPEASLYARAQQVLYDIEQSWESSNKEAPSWYYGLQEFYKHLQATLAEYQVQNNKVVHISQQSSRALVDAIQLMGLANSALDREVAKKLEQCSQTVAKFGSKEQQGKLAHALKLHKEHNSSFFLPLLDSFEKHLVN